MSTLKLLTLVKIYINTYICQALTRYSSRSYCKSTGRVLLTCITLVFQSSNFSSKALKSIRTLMVLALMVSMFSLSAQTPRKDSGADGLKEAAMLTVGQKVPDSFWTYKYKFYSNGDTQTKTLEHLKGSPIIFDFWASWCSPCISSLIETNSFIGKLTEKGNFIAVTSDNKTTALNTWIKQDLHLPTIIEDKILKKFFPHASVPQVIWIDADGMVRYQTSQEPLSQANLNSFFAGQSLDLKAKPVFDKNLPILPGIQADKNVLQCYQLVLKGYQDYLPVAKYSRNLQEGYFSTSFVNLPLITIYRDLAPRLFSAIGEPFFRENFQIKTDDSIELNRPYTLDLIVPTRDQLIMNKGMVELLNAASGYNAGLQKETRQCLVMKRIGQIPQSIASNGKLNRSIDWEKKIQIDNAPIAYALGILTDQRLAGKYIVNETGYKGKIDLNIRVTNDLGELNAQLAKSGMKLENAIRDINVFVVEKAKGK
ncbi:TlpA disulfide reductase family protein [Sphingobacterium sp. DR205]|uniref:TlpA family protein disulfide reductase n=1 Tax=Sphingobacterium sp. DR205 TaxID=2713573 RepID=UPI0013E491BF|nr:TlpA disulfide reductase family protein [Sphingobacterium sp. DR205]QIH35500.1 TlpA family protein disulfide reductase [Sphingobacterium sp. DR205]